MFAPWMARGAGMIVDWGAIVFQAGDGGVRLKEGKRGGREGGARRGGEALEFVFPPGGGARANGACFFLVWDAVRKYVRVRMERDDAEKV